MAYVRTVRTASGPTAVQVVYSSRRGSRDIEHIGSAHHDAELEVLKAAARQRIAAGQAKLDLGLEITARRPCGAAAAAVADHPSRMGHLLAALERGYQVLGFEQAAAGRVTRCSGCW